MITIRHKLLVGVSAAVVWTVIVAVVSYVKLARFIEYDFQSYKTIEDLPWMYAVAFLVWTTQWRLDISIKEGYLKQYIWLLGFKFGFRENLAEIDKIYINRSKAVEYVYFPSPIKPNAPLEFCGYQFQAYLKFKDGKKIKFQTHRNKETLVKQLKDHNLVLKTVIQDNTLETQAVIE